MRRMFERILIANRGEIAVRIAKTLRRMGIRTVVVASIPDRRSLAVRTADEAVLLEGYSAAESYLDIDAVIAAAKATGCQAIHPGYGFLSERADFAERCAAEGITFIGPPPQVLRGMGDKAAARQLAVANGVPVVPGWDGDDATDTLTRQAALIGFPVMLKARGGGGGRGMREVYSAGDLPDAIESARREALAAFGDGGLLLEKLVTNAHHVEVQVLADGHGNVVHLGERDCSVQRRHQKLIEETPSPVVDGALRERLTRYALALARAIGYVNAGTFEFLVDPAGPGGAEVYFLEVNPRLQVEHPVTELVTGLDLVELQVRIAAGEPLPFAQQDVRFAGHAIEFRVNAEDPWDGFKPSAGRISVLWDDASRFDAGFEAGDSVPHEYDSLIAKRIFFGADRRDALDQARGVMGPDDLIGPRSNLGLLRAIALHPDFEAGRATVDWLERELSGLLQSARRTDAEWVAAAATAAARGGWIGAGRAAFWLNDGIETVAAEVSHTAPGRGTVWLRGEPDGHGFETAGDGEGTTVETAGQRLRTFMDDGSNGLVVTVGQDIYVTAPPPMPRRAHAASEGATAITAPLAGTIVAVRVAEGEAVEEGQLLVVLEAMKMEHRISAPTAGAVRTVHVRERDVVRENDPLVELE